MELELQEWLFLILGLVILGVLAHGFWVQYFGGDHLPLKLDKGFVSAAPESDPGKDVIDLKAELPNGGARVVTVGNSTIPVTDPSETRSRQAARQQPPPDSETADEMPPIDPSRDRADQYPSGSISNASHQAVKPVSDGSIATQAQKTASTEAAISPPAAQPEMLFLVLNILGEIPGQPLLESLMEQGFEYGEKSIFHRLDDAGYPKISLANAVEPGIFEIAAMGDLVTPGVTVFMCAHECEDAPAVFEELLMAAAHLAEDLGAQLCDDRRSAVTEQTVAHLRQSVQEFQFRRTRAL